MLELYKKIRARREELNMSQEELAKKLGYKSRSSINKIEKGENDIPQSKIVAFAHALDTTPEDLMGWQKSDGNVDMFRTIRKDPPDLTKFLQQSEIMFDGDTYNLSDTDREKIQAALRLAFWDAKKQNKRKKD